jgi:hypothetical protein
MTIITIPFAGNINQILSYGRNASKDYEGTFKGDANEGRFDFKALGGTFTGEYRVNKNLIEIAFSKKPFFIPTIVIENFLKTHIK